MYVEVNDVNDHAPQTDEPSYRIYVPEDTLPGTDVLTLSATDRDVADAAATDDDAATNISFFVRSVRGRRNTEASAQLGEEGWGPDTDGGELFGVDRRTGEGERGRQAKEEGWGRRCLLDSKLIFLYHPYHCNRASLVPMQVH